MALSIFEDKSVMPAGKDLSKVLAGSFSVWNTIKDFVVKNYPAAIEEWKHSGKNYGWGYRLKDKKRVIVYMTPSEGFFRFSMVLGEKATCEALSSTISKEIKALIEQAPVYAEGRGFRMEVKNDEYIEDIRKMILIKLAN